MTKQEAQQGIDALNAVSMGGLPINSLAPIVTVAQALQRHINSIDEAEKGKKENPEDPPMTESIDS